VGREREPLLRQGRTAHVATKALPLEVGTVYGKNGANLIRR